MRELYDTHRSAFLNWMQRELRLSPYDAAEVYQKTIIIFYNNLQSGKLTRLSSALKTYLYGIGKRVAFETWRSEGRTSSMSDLPRDAESLDYSYLEREQANHQKQLVEAFLQQVGEKCRKLLKMYYFRGFSMEIIATRMGYKSEDVAKKSKYECMKKLKKLARDQKLVS